MIRNLAAWIVKVLTPVAYHPFKLDSVNQKLCEPVIGLSGYWKFANVADMPQARFVHYLNLTNRLKMNIDEQDLIKYLDGMKAAFEAKDSGKFFGLEFLLRDTVTTCTPIETYYWMAALLYFDEQEDLKTFDYDYNLRKVEYFKSLPDTSFFLARLIESLQKSGGLLVTDIKASLQEAQVKANQYTRIRSELLKSDS